MPVTAEFLGRETTPFGLTIIVLGVLFASGKAGSRIVLIPTVAVLTMVWVCFYFADPYWEGVHFLAVAGLLFYSIWLTLTYLRERHRVNAETLAAAASIYLLFGLACGAVYAALGEFNPGGLGFVNSDRDLTFHDHIYFSFVALTTIGFGDIVPRDAMNRSLSMLEAICGLFYVTLVISRFTNLFRAPSEIDD